MAAFPIVTLNEKPFDGWVNMAQQQALPPFAIFDDYRPTVTIAVIIRWLLLGVWLFLNNYRVEQDQTHLVLNLMGGGLALLNGWISWRLFQVRSVQTANLGNSGVGCSRARPQDRESAMDLRDEGTRRCVPGRRRLARVYRVV